MMKLGLFLFLQLKDGTLTSSTPPGWSTSQALCVWPLRTRRGWSHHSSWQPRKGRELMHRLALIHHGFTRVADRATHPIQITIILNR